VGDPLSRLILCTAVCLVAACSTPAVSVVPRADIALEVQADGSLLAIEKYNVTFSAPRTTFHRSSKTGFFDSIADIKGSMDDVAFTNGGGERQFLSGADDRVDAEWRFPAATGAHVFTLSYRAVNAVRLSGIRGRVVWDALPLEAQIGDAIVTLSLPPGAIHLQDPWVMQAGWDVVREDRAMRATKRNLLKGESGTIGAEFTIDTMYAAQPSWQFREMRATEFQLAFLSAGAFVLVVAAGVVAMVRFRHSRTEGEAVRDERQPVARGLKVSGWVSIAAGIGGLVLVRATLGGYGPWPYAIPLATIASGILFVVYGRRMERAV
jgi:hypothetical protein